MIKLLSIAKQILTEGGNVFKITAPIERDNIEPTIEHFIEQLSRLFPDKASTFKSFEKLGSAGKKPISGDLDLSYDVKNIFPDGENPDFEGWNVDKQKYNELVDLFTKRARTATPEQIHLRAMVVLIGEKINTLPDVEVDLKSSGAGVIFCAITQYDKMGNKLDKSVQTDINIGNPEWLKFSRHSSAYEGEIKGLHRTQLIVSLFLIKNRTFNHSIGVINKDTREIEASHPEDVIKLLNKLYNFNISKDILDDYFKLKTFIKQHLSKDEYDKVKNAYLDILSKTKGAYIPNDL
jgi:hypothetical protein